MAQYAGESLAKKVARVRLYKRAREALRWRLPSLKNLKAFFLIGDSASEVGALKHLLGVAPENMFGLDRNPIACQALRDKEPAATVVNGDLLSVNSLEAAHDFCKPKGFGFGHLDLMGNVGKHTDQLYTNWTQFFLQNSVLALTFLRGRELPETRKWYSKALAVPSTMSDVPKVQKWLLGADYERTVTHMNLLNSCAVEGTWMRTCYAEGHVTDIAAAADLLDNLRQDVWDDFRREHFVKKGIFVPVASHAYRAAVSPMGVLLTLCISPSAFTDAGLVQFTKRRGRLTMSVISKTPMEDLLLEADSLEKEFSKQQVAEILDVSTGTLAAWRAHRTMGTYEAA